MRLDKLFLESPDDISNSISQHPQLCARGQVIQGWNIFKKYLELSASFDAYLSGWTPCGTFDFEPQEFVLTAENVTGQPLSTDGFESFGRLKDDIGEEFGGKCGNNPQSPVPVKPGEIVNVFESTSESSIRGDPEVFQ
jgi:hypothetical protein